MADVAGTLARFDPFAAGRLGGAAAAGLRYVVMDVFTEQSLAGNQLAVFVQGGELSGETMQRLARELNLSETVFLLAGEEGAVRVRIFTPAEELPFAGHPVLGSAILLASALEQEEVTLETGRGPVPVTVAHGEGAAPFARMSQPLPSWEPFGRERELLDAIGLERSELPVELYDNGPKHVFVELADERAVAALRPDLAALARLGALCVSCFAGGGERFKTRMFAPAVGVAEDPATGSAAGPLAVHLGRHGRVPFGREIELRQGAEIGRPSLLRACAHASDGVLERVEVAGSAVFAASGRFVL